MNITRYIFTAAIYMLSSVIVSTFIYNTPASAASDGLKLSTSRQSISVKPGDSTATRLNITNESPRPMDVLLGVQAFIVDPATHAVNFSTPKETWVTPHLPRITLAPGASQEITYRIAVPAVASEQEYHFALVASTTIQQGDSTRTLRVASLLYLYADGGHLRRSSDITDVKIPSFVVTGDIPYGFTIKNTGNIHIEARTTTQLQASQHTDTDNRFVIMPGEKKYMSGRLPAPFWPGVYTVMYGYTDQLNGSVVQESMPVIYIPLWALGVVAVFVLCSIWLVQRSRPTSDQ